MKDKFIKVSGLETQSSWGDKNPDVVCVDFLDFIENPEIQKQAVKLANSARVVGLLKDDEICGAVVNRNTLFAQSLFASETEESYFDLLNHRVLQSDLAKGNIPILKDDDQPVSHILYDNQLKPVLGLVNVPYLDEYIVSNKNSECFFNAKHEEEFRQGVGAWDERMEVVQERLGAGSERLSKEMSKDKVGFLAYLAQEGFLSRAHRTIYGYDQAIKEGRPRLDHILRFAESGESDAPQPDQGIELE